MRIDTDAPQRDLLTGLEQGSEFGKLPNTVRSPVAAKKYEDDRLPAALGGQRELASILIFEREVWRGVAGGNGPRGLGSHSMTGDAEAGTQA